MKPAIVIAAYNRPDSLKRLLYSVENAIYHEKDVPLIISIDNSGSNDVAEVAESFQWDHGPYEVIKRPERLGLREHILRCGDLTEFYDGVILIEDDLFVSPFFYEYSLKAGRFYNEDARIAGISLYSQHYNEAARSLFVPLNEDRHSYFLGIASSWGQLWTKLQWKNFRTWYNNNLANKDLSFSSLSWDIQIWPPTSWKKYFIKFMQETGKTFVYPVHSLTTNFGDDGIHHRNKGALLQTVLQHCPVDYRFARLDESNAVYDVFHEILPDRLGRISKKWDGKDITMDLYGQKNLDHATTKYIVSCKTVQDPEKKIGRALRPHEMNLVHETEGAEFSYAEKEQFENQLLRPEKDNSYLAFYYRIPGEFLK